MAITLNEEQIKKLLIDTQEPRKKFSVVFNNEVNGKMKATTSFALPFCNASEILSIMDIFFSPKMIYH